jgi:hypothetical protein
MAEIIQFPVPGERDWLNVESFIRKEMEEAQTPEVVINEVLSWLKDLWFELREQPIHYQIKGPGVCREAIDEVVHAVIGQMRDKLYLAMVKAGGQKRRLEMLKHRHNL